MKKYLIFIISISTIFTLFTGTASAWFFSNKPVVDQRCVKSKDKDKCIYDWKNYMFVDKNVFEWAQEWALFLYNQYLYYKNNPVYCAKKTLLTRKCTYVTYSTEKLKKGATPTMINYDPLYYTYWNNKAISLIMGRLPTEYFLIKADMAKVINNLANLEYFKLSTYPNTVGDQMILWAVNEYAQQEIMKTEICLMKKYADSNTKDYYKSCFSKEMVNYGAELYPDEGN